MLGSEFSPRVGVYVLRPNVLLTRPPSRLTIHIALPARGHGRGPCHDVRITNSNTVASILTPAWQSLVYDHLRRRAPLRPTLVDELERMTGAVFPISQTKRVECCPSRARVLHHDALTPRPPHGVAKGLGRSAEHTTGRLIQLAMYARE